ncbi:MAG: 2-C-methyl-D-erythritol 4-phosphate cytidylyltransferase [Candidatus Omnitrophica bacterium]|nr:2-C-methyl-D-erythritol 4-phosphate cytidylyltransferase [Candidatus Omnitrophota bacterium]
MKVEAIIAAAGVGERLKNPLPKPLVKIQGKPIFVHTLEIFEKCSLIDDIILVVHPKHLKDYRKYAKAYSLSKVKTVVAGGDCRRDSVLNGLKALDKDTDIVVVHDGVRPLVTPKIITDSIKACRKHPAVIVAVKVKPTIKRVDEQLFVEATLKRDKLWEIQTPQVFQKDILLKAYQKTSLPEATDDASLVEEMGVKVKILEGDYRNIKITTPEDLIIAEAFLKQTVIPAQAGIHDTK